MEFQIAIYFFNFRRRQPGAAGVPSLLQSQAATLHSSGVLPDQTNSENTQISSLAHTTKGKLRCHRDTITY